MQVVEGKQSEAEGTHGQGTEVRWQRVWHEDPANIQLSTQYRRGVSGRGWTGSLGPDHERI